MNKNSGQELENKFSSRFYDSYCSLAESYSNAVSFLQDRDQAAYEIFFKWYSREGIGYFENIETNILKDKLDNRFVVFIDIYKSYLEDAMEENCKQVLLDFYISYLRG